jgi:hydroxypyruvate reductase
MDPHDLARRLVSVALAAVDPERLVREDLCRRKESFGAVVALGKAASAFARGVRDVPGVLAPGARRLLVRTQSTPALLDPAWEQKAGGHPLPDRQSVAAGTRLLEWLDQIPPGRPLLVLLSGGSSACVERPAPGISLDDLVATQKALLASGLPIHSVNAVRKHLSALKGGGALRTIGGRASRVLALLLSDVPGDDPATIGSGPFAADPTTFAEALEAVSGLPVPEEVRRHLAAGARGEILETLKPGDSRLDPVETVLLGSVRTAVAAVVAEARRRDLHAVDGNLEGEAAAAACELVERGRALKGEPRLAVILGGETTVTLHGGTGRGGRNQELALAAAREISGSPDELVFTLATDGEDGPTRAAGGVVDGTTWEEVRRAGIDPDEALARHDSGAALAAVPGALLTTGPTGTNVGDLAVYLRLRLG